MAVEDSSFELPLRDLFTRVIPGFILIFPGLIAVSVVFQGVLDYPALLSISILVLSLFVGEIIDQFRIGPHRVPPSFREFVATVTDNPDILPFPMKAERYLRNRLSHRYEPGKPGFRNRFLTLLFEPEDRVWARLPMDFSSEFEEELGVDFESHAAGDIFDILIIHLEPSLGRRTLRAQMDYNLRQNALVASIASFALYGMYLIVAIRSGEHLPQFLLAFLLSCTVTALFMTILLFLDRAEVHYNELLFKEFYNRHEGTKES